MPNTQFIYPFCVKNLLTDFQGNCFLQIWMVCYFMRRFFLSRQSQPPPEDKRPPPEDKQPPPEDGHAWFDFDDSRVQPITVKDIEKQFSGKESAYMLFYRKCSMKRPQAGKVWFVCCVGHESNISISRGFNTNLVTYTLHMSSDT